MPRTTRPSPSSRTTCTGAGGAPSLAVVFPAAKGEQSVALKSPAGRWDLREATEVRVATKVGGVIVFTPPAHTEKVVREAAAAGIKRIWIQQGAQSEEALAFCREKDLPAITRQCILMYVEPVDSIHGVHRWVKKLFGGMPK